jgi:hypothetical protein
LVSPTIESTTSGSGFFALGVAEGDRFAGGLRGATGLRAAEEERVFDRTAGFF